MLWALASSAFVVYLYRSLNAEVGPAVEDAPPGSIETEIAALNARISALEHKLEMTMIEEPRP